MFLSLPASNFSPDTEQREVPPITCYRHDYTSPLALRPAILYAPCAGGGAYQTGQKEQVYDAAHTGHYPGDYGAAWARQCRRGYGHTHYHGQPDCGTRWARQYTGDSRHRLPRRALCPPADTAELVQNFTR